MTAMRMLVIAGLLCASAAGLARASTRPESARSPTPSARACHSAVRHRVLPTWARTGFSNPRPRLPHVLGRSGAIAALVFGYPLHAPPLEDRGNKILWVSRRAVKPLSDLRIHAQLMRGHQRVGRPVVRVVVGGPGPSGINLPSPGCWRLTLQWSGRTDHLDLEYRSRGQLSRP
jgi:hypothetical protein